MTQIRKTLPQLKQEIDQHRKLIGKMYLHNKTGDNYQLLFLAFDEETNALVAIYCSSSMPWLKFTRPIEQFLQKFTELGIMK